MTPRRKILSGLATAIVATLLSGAVSAQAVDLSPAQPGRVRAQKVDTAVQLIGKDYKFAKPGAFTVAIAGGRLPFATYGTDTRTLVGSEPDIAQLVADSLGLQLELVPTAWADWPLGLQSGKYDAVISNVTVTEARKEKFDFSTYRKDQLGIYVKTDSPIKAIKDPKDIAGLRVIVQASTNQEQILLRWNERNVAAGLKPVEIQYYDDEVVQRLAIQSGRADAYLGPNAIAAFEAARSGDTRLAGTFSGGWPQQADIAVTTRKGAGLADAITAALNAQIADGNYTRALARWKLATEAIDKSVTNPPGLPKN
jgi:polar amino acid transport system substrate-binding protein